MTKHQPPLYVRRQNKKIQGPFPAGQISQSLLLGRFKLTDEVSADKEEWVPIQQRPDLIPDVLKADPHDELAKERLNAARRWADERRPIHGEGQQAERRSPESYETLEYRHNREAIYQQVAGKREFSILQLLLVLGIGVGLILLGFTYAPKEQVSEPDCTAPAGPGVNWRNCRMAGLSAIRSDLTGALLNNAILGGANLFAAQLNKADIKYADLSLANLSYADLSYASLKGAGLQNADLTQAELQRADLSYANLTGAKLEGADLTGATLDHAIWIDGHTCMAGSVGECKTLKR